MITTTESSRKLVYLDWNCITHSKKGGNLKNVKLFAENNSEKFVFPYSNAHIRDLVSGRVDGNDYIKTDLEILNQICGNHLLFFMNNIIWPVCYSPIKFYFYFGPALKLIQDSELISIENYNFVKKLLRESLPTRALKEIQNAQPLDVIRTINTYLNLYCPSFPNIWTLCHATNKMVNDEAVFKHIYSTIELFGFRPEEKSKRITNIDTDASHLYYASHCDYFVTNDRKMRDKAKAIFPVFHSKTKVISPDKLLDIN